MSAQRHLQMRSPGFSLVVSTYSALAPVYLGVSSSLSPNDKLSEILVEWVVGREIGRRNLAFITGSKLAVGIDHTWNERDSIRAP